MYLFWLLSFGMKIGENKTIVQKWFKDRPELLPNHQSLTLVVESV